MSSNRSRGVAKAMLRAGAGLDYRDAHRKSVTPRVWLRVWAAQYPRQKYDLEHDRLVALTPKEPADFERIGKWKDAASSAAKWKANVASVAYIVWMEAASERPTCPTDDRIAAFLQDWSSREYEDRFSKGTVRKRFGLSRATTLLYFLSDGRFPIFDSRVRRAIARLTGRPVPNTVQGYVDSYLPLFAQIAASCGAKNFRTVDQALFSYGGKDAPTPRTR
jgi:hypothetical protein